MSFGSFMGVHYLTGYRFACLGVNIYIYIYTHVLSQTNWSEVINDFALDVCLPNKVVSQLNLLQLVYMLKAPPGNNVGVGFKQRHAPAATHDLKGRRREQIPFWVDKL